MDKVEFGLGLFAFLVFCAMIVAFILIAWSFMRITPNEVCEAYFYPHDSYFIKTDYNGNDNVHCTMETASGMDIVDIKVRKDKFGSLHILP